eukprot:1745224-Alexandrium_andersonii.AAC.1
MNSPAPTPPRGEGGMGAVGLFIDSPSGDVALLKVFYCRRQEGPQTTQGASSPEGRLATLAELSL